ncbi:DUF4062 domain-containing protein, partial [Synergistaceae bacterium OttesenSCG-928-D05]|nr:DUF4062 domain-containing protein [Synergistaceae bacterium OttesenSCG-928-D05]
MIPERKIKIFVSSMCGDEPGREKYKLVRAAIVELIESTNFATAYAFEYEGASSVSAKCHYIMNLKDSDLCVFLIDNFDKISKGVQEEINLVKKHRIKSLCYFCEENSKKKTSFQIE